MTLVKSDTKLGNFAEAGTKKPNGKSVAINFANELSSFSLTWLLLKRHKVTLLAIGNIILVLNWAIPEWTQMVLTIFR